MDRRALLATVGTGISVGLTGCLGGSEENEGEFPEEVDTGWWDGPFKDDFKIMGTDAPEEIPVREPFEVKVAFGNVNDETKNLAATLEFDAAEDYESSRSYRNEDEGLNASIEQTGVSSGDVKVITREFFAASVGEYALSIGGINGISFTTEEGYTRPRLRVVPREGTTNETIEVTDQFEVTPNVSFVNSFEYETTGFGANSEVTQRNTPPEQVIAVVTATVQNTGMEPLQADEGLFQTGDGGEVITELSNGSLESAMLEGEPLLQMNLPEGEETTGWIAFVYERNQIENATIQFGVYPDDWTANRAEVVWNLTSEEGLPPAE